MSGFPIYISCVHFCWLNIYFALLCIKEPRRHNQAYTHLYIDIVESVFYVFVYYKRDRSVYIYNKRGTMITHTMNFSMVANILCTHVYIRLVGLMRGALSASAERHKLCRFPFLMSSFTK